MHSVLEIAEELRAEIGSAITSGAAAIEYVGEVYRWTGVIVGSNAKTARRISVRVVSRFLEFV